ncbi:hypothetical protein Micbo1qcDRAFT_179670 [Microdochium bolleyi]|uniref:Secreted protein n=1 Tax=Microdochium bolleyi TaxID=196109 RepID=A0A136IPA3_9PEZI|nr:hypothetical protein Micbo1qcDRAFT_179670 [Microdochium bolleyi]
MALELWVSAQVLWRAFCAVRVTRTSSLQLITGDERDRQVVGCSWPHATRLPPAPSRTGNNEAVHIGPTADDPPGSARRVPQPAVVSNAGGRQAGNDERGLTAITSSYMTHDDGSREPIARRHSGLAIRRGPP